MRCENALAEQKTEDFELLRKAVLERLHGKKPIMLGMLAQEFSVSELLIARALPEEMCSFAPKEAFDAVWQELTTWPTATFIVQHLGSVLELRGAIPPGSHARGYFTLGEGLPLGGHLKVDALEAIGFLSMPFMGMESLSLQFFNTAGTVLFSVYAGRGQDKQIFTEIAESFCRLRRFFSKEGL